MKKIILLLFQFFISTLILAQSPMNFLGNWDDNSLAVKYGLSYNDCWGYATGGREYAIMGSLEKVHFFEINSTAPVIDPVATFALGANSVWRDFKTYGTYAYASADEGAEGLLVFNLSNINETSNRVTLASQNNTVFTKAHNIFIDVPEGKLYCAGSNNGVSGLVIFDLKTTPNTPQLCGLIPTGYVHDVHVRNGKVYCSQGYLGLKIYDGTAINNWTTGNTIVSTLPLLAENNTLNSGYNHSSWLNTSGTHLIMAEETHGKALKILDVSDLSAVSQFTAPTSTFMSCMLCPLTVGADGPIVHNPFVKGNLVYLAYYHEGIQVYDISNPAAPTKVAFYDTEPSNTNYAGYAGLWGTYPFLPSGKILASDVTNGLFVLSLPASVLPTSLSDFKAKTSTNTVDITWKTVSESPQMVFEVEKSLDGIRFEKIKSEKSKNLQGANYQVSDDAPQDGINYYRLKIIEKDASFRYSAIVEARFLAQNHTPVLYPNPSEDGNAQIVFPYFQNDTEASVEIFDTQAKLIQTYHPINTKQFCIKNLQNGFYHVKITYQGKSWTQSLLVDRR
jgi:choice-of-anchor B domain-containing protein